MRRNTGPYQFHQERRAKITKRQDVSIQVWIVELRTNIMKVI